MPTLELAHVVLLLQSLLHKTKATTESICQNHFASIFSVATVAFFRWLFCLPSACSFGSYVSPELSADWKPGWRGEEAVHTHREHPDLSTCPVATSSCSQRSSTCKGKAVPAASPCNPRHGRFLLQQQLLVWPFSTVKLLKS